MGGVELGVFGPVVSRGPSGLIEFSRAKERAVLAALVLFRGHAVPTDRLVDALWGDEPPVRADKALQTHVQRLRAALGPGIVETHSDGYALAASVAVDVELFESEATADGSAQCLRAALARWKGEPFVDLGEWLPARLERERLTELRDHALESCLALEIEAGPAGACIGELETMVAEKPLRERRWLLLMAALQRDGRVADALRAYQRARHVFVEELGIDPGPELRALEDQILMEGVEANGTFAVPPPAQTLPSGVVTFLLTDVEDSTESWERDASDMSRALQLHDKAIAAAVSGEAGTLLKLHGEGESTFSVFARASDAVNAALVARRALDADDWPEGPRLEARFAVHMGEVEERDGEYLGTAVNRAARIRSIAVGGQILISNAVAEVVRDHLADEVSVVELGEQHLRGLAHSERVWAVVDAARPVREAIGGVCPYKGLLAFEPEDSDVFFGREETVGVLLGRLLARRLVVLMGASGSGKSSVVRAGVAAALMRGEVAGSEGWSSVIVSPGEHPLAVLPEELGRVADAANRVVIVVDQMEELFTACRDPTEREQFVDALLDAVDHSDGSVLVACALRADFYGHCAAIPRLASALSDSSVLLGVMTDRELRRAIEAPAVVAGLRLETGLVEVILADLGQEPGSLPLLSHALLETWRRRSGRTLTLHGYRESGGVRSAIAKTAESVWSDALTERRQPVARRIFLRLTELGEGTEDTRRRVMRSELVSGVDAEATNEVLGLLVDRRLVTADDTTVQVAHEALIREWPRLRAWLDDDREGLRAHRHLTHAAEDWASLGRAASELYRGPRLAAAREWLARDDAAQLNELEAAFMHESDALEQTERAARERATRRFRALFAATALLLVIAVAGGLVATVQRNRAQREATLADSQRLAAQARDIAGSHIDLALLLAVEARRLDDSVAARGSLEEVLSDGARLERFIAIGAYTARVLSHDGRLQAVGHADGTVEVRDLVDGHIVTAFADGTSSVAGVGFSVDSRTLAVTHRDGTVDLRDIAGGTGRTLAGHADGYWTRPVFSPDDRRLAAIDSRGDVAVWDLTSSVPPAATLGGPISDATAVAWTSNGRTLAVDYADVGKLVVWDVFSRRPARQLPIPDSLGSQLALGPDGRTLALGGLDGRIRLFDLATGRASGPTLGEPGPSVEWLAFSPDGTTLAAANAAGTVTQWDLASKHPDGPPLVGVGADTTFGLLATGGRLITVGPTSLGVWRLTTVGPALGRLVADFSGTPAAFALSPNGALAFLTATTARRWVLYDMARGHIIATHTKTDISFSAAWSPDATKVAIGRPDGRVHLFDPRSGANFGLFVGQHSPVFTVAFSPDGRSLAGGSGDGTVIVWNVATHRPVGAPFRAGGEVQGAAFSPDGKTLAIADLGGTLRLFDVATHRLRYTYDAHEPLFHVAFSSHGMTLAVGTYSGETFLIDAASGRRLGAPLTGHGGPVLDVGFSGDGRTLATGSFDGTVILYDVASRQPIGEPLDAGYGGLDRAELTTDGHTLGSAYLQGQVVIWDIDPNAWQQRACVTAGRNLTHDEWHQYLGSRPYHKTCAQWPAGT